MNPHFFDRVTLFGRSSLIDSAASMSILESLELKSTSSDSGLVALWRKNRLALGSLSSGTNFDDGGTARPLPVFFSILADDTVAADSSAAGGGGLLFTALLSGKSGGGGSFLGGSDTGFTFTDVKCSILGDGIC